VITDLSDNAEWSSAAASLAIGMSCDNLAVIYPAKPPRAGELRCATCNSHRGWAPKQMMDFITDITRRFGAPPSPITWRQEINVMTKQYDNTGILFRDDRKSSNKERDYRGELTIAGVGYWVSGWIKQGKKGKFLSLTIKPKDAPAIDKSKPLADERGDTIPF